MHYGVDLGNMEALWKRALHELDGSCSARSSDDEKERAFWHGYFEKKTEYCPDEYSRPIAAAVRAILTDKHPDTILEIGPGWGNYGNTAQKSRRDTARSDIIRPWINR